jgi:hypothetical protein
MAAPLVLWGQILIFAFAHWRSGKNQDLTPSFVHFIRCDDFSFSRHISSISSVSSTMA